MIKFMNNMKSAAKGLFKPSTSRDIVIGSIHCRGSRGQMKRVETLECNIEKKTCIDFMLYIQALPYVLNIMKSCQALKIN